MTGSGPIRFPRRLVISLHDATPFHLDRMRRAEAVFRDLGVTMTILPH